MRRHSRPRAYAIFRKELTQVGRDRSTLALVALLPIMLLILYGYGVSTDIRNIPMVVLDSDRSVQSRTFIRAFTGSGFFRVEKAAFSMDDVDLEMDSGRAKMGIVLPPKFGRSVERGKLVEVMVAVDGTEPNTANAAISYVSRIVSNYSSKIGTRIIRNRIATERLQPVDLRARVRYNPEMRSINFIVPGLIVTILMSISALLTSVTIVRELEQGTLEPLIASPIKAWELMAGKIGAYALISFLDIILVLTVGTLWFKVPFRGSILTLLGTSAIFLLSSLGVGLAVSARSKTQQSAILLAFIITLIPGLMLSGFLFPISSMPHPVQILTWLIPARYFLVIVRSIFLKGVGLEVLWPQLVPLFVIGAILFIISIRSFRKQMG